MNTVYETTGHAEILVGQLRRHITQSRRSLSPHEISIHIRTIRAMHEHAIISGKGLLLDTHL